MDALRFDVEQNEAADDILSRRVDRIERALHELLENPGGIFAASSRARDLLNAEL